MHVLALWNKFFFILYMNSHPKYRFYQPLSIPGIVTPDSNVIFDATPNHVVFRGVVDFTDATFIGLPDGGVSGPDTSLINSVARFAGTTGKVIKDSGVIIDDNANITCNSIKIGSNVVLTANALGSNVTSSSLTSVGVLQNLQVDDILIDSNIIGTINGVDLHIHSATGNIFIDNFATPNSILSIDANSKIVAASNSIYLKEIDQNLSTTSSPTFVSINGTILTASQPNITSLGTLTSLNVSGDVSLLSLTPNSYLVLDGSSKVVAATNSTHLAAIDQTLSTVSTPTFTSVSASYMSIPEIRSSGAIHLIPNSSSLIDRFTLSISGSVAIIDGNGLDVFIGNTTDDKGIITPHITVDNLSTNSYVMTDSQKKLISASNSSHLASINQPLSTTSNVFFNNVSSSQLFAGQLVITDGLIARPIDNITIMPNGFLVIDSNVKFNYQSPNTYLMVDNSNTLISASNSSHLALIDQGLSSNSNVQFAGIKSTDNIYLDGDKLVQFRHDFPNDTHYAIHWLSNTWDLRIILDKDTVSEKGVSFGHYEDNDMDKTWTEYVKIKNNGTISLNGLTADTVLSLDANKSVIGEVRGSAFNKNFGHGQNDVPRGWWLSSGSYTPTINASSNVTGAAFNSAYYCRMHKIIHIHATATIAASTQSDVASISFDVPVIDAFISEYRANGMAVAQTVDGQESHPARIFAVEGSKRVRMTWWSATTGTVKWSILVSIYDTGDV